MAIISRLHNSLLLVLCSLFPPEIPKKRHKGRTENVPFSCPAGYIPIYPDDLHRYLTGPDRSAGHGSRISIFIPQVFALTAPFLLGYLKRRGYSGCRAEVTSGGLAVTAER